MDPEIGLSIVEMCLIRELHASERGLRLVMTLTHQSCPLGAVMLDLVREVLRPLCPESEPKIELSFDRPWTLQSITPAARGALGR
jgi:metal-sulfur cluster biosynthetic enzyme